MKIEELRYQGNRVDNGETVFGTPYFDSHRKAFILLEDEKAIPGPGGHGGQCRFTSKYNHTLALHVPAFEVDEATICKA
jgi:hypothetical protein